MWRLIRLIPSRAAIWAVAVAAVTAAVAWLRADARKGARDDLKRKDADNAEAIHQAAADVRHDLADGLRPNADDGWRD